MGTGWNFLASHQSNYWSPSLSKSEGLGLQIRDFIDQKGPDPGSPVGSGQGILLPYICHQKAVRKILAYPEPPVSKPFDQVQALSYGDVVFSIKNLLYPNCFMATLDLRDAYLHIPIHPAFQRFLRPAVKMGTEIRHFQFQAFPFNLSSAPCIFTKVLGEVLAQLRLKAIPIIPYLDDLLVVAESYQKLLADLQTVQDILQFLGWLINKEKSSLILAQKVTYLGYEFFSVDQKVFLPQEKFSRMM